MDTLKRTDEVLGKRKRFMSSFMLLAWSWMVRVNTVRYSYNSIWNYMQVSEQEVNLVTCPRQTEHEYFDTLFYPLVMLILIINELLIRDPLKSCVLIYDKSCLKQTMSHILYYICCKIFELEWWSLDNFNLLDEYYYCILYLL